MRRRALTFGLAAVAYERYRPGYPLEMVDLVIDYGPGPTRTALEIGAGTGKATRAFVQRGIDVLATEPDAQMLAELRTQVPAARTLQAPFEEVPTSSTYDLVYSAAALHWTDPATRWDRTAALLRPRGIFASFGGPVRLANRADRDAFEAARRPDVEDDEVPAPDGTPDGAKLRWPGTELVRSDLFEDVQQHVIERRERVPAAHYVGYLSTVSAYLQLPPTQRAEVLGRIVEALPEHVEVSSDLDVHLARRRPDRAAG
jgi:SAM-dependent methyltransferase